MTRELTKMQREELLSLVPADLRVPGRVFIAGGYAADAERASDLDLWILMPPGTDVQRLRRHLGKTELLPTMQDEYTINLSSRGFAKIGDVVTEFMEGALAFELPQLIQVLASTHATVELMLQEFDISTHQVAIDVVTGERRTVETTTALDQRPRVTFWRTPVTTLQRLEKITGRYGFALSDHPDVPLLQSLACSVQDAIAA